MSDDALLADANLAEIARLRTELADRDARAAQHGRALEAERRARQMAEARLEQTMQEIVRGAAFQSPPPIIVQNADLSHQIGELNTTIGYQDAMLQRTADMLFTLSYRSELDDNTRAAIKDLQLVIDSALHDPSDVTALRLTPPATSQL